MDDRFKHLLILGREHFERREVYLRMVESQRSERSSEAPPRSSPEEPLT